VAFHIYSDSTLDVKRDGTAKQGMFHDDLTIGDTYSTAGNDVLLSEEMGKPRRPCISGCY
jgi:hypothetical protein